MDANGSTMTRGLLSSSTMTTAGDTPAAPAPAQGPPDRHRPEAQQQPRRDPAIRAGQRPADRTDHRPRSCRSRKPKSMPCSTR